jgi:uncharacterized protein YegL
MIGPPLDAVKQGIQQLIGELRSDPMALETVWISLITFSRSAQQLCPLREVLQFQIPELAVGPGTSLGASLQLLAQCIAREVRKSTSAEKGDWKPLIFLITDGSPTDNWQEALRLFWSASAGDKANVIAIGCGEDADATVLSQVTPNVLMMKDMSSGSFRAFFKWVSASVSTASVKLGTSGAAFQVPSLPEGITSPSANAGCTSPLPSQHIFAARCQKSGGIYLMRYRRKKAQDDVFEAESVGYPVNNDYVREAQSCSTGLAIDCSKLRGAPPCPYCGNAGWTLSPEEARLICSPTLSIKAGRAQVMFVLDITGSMAGEIDGVKDNSKAFVDYIRSKELAVEVGLVAFRDLEENEPHEVLQFQHRAFTGDAGEFKRQVRRLRANGGGANAGESSLSALELACRQMFSQDASRILILITDEPPLIPDGEVQSYDDVGRALREARIDRLHMVLADHLVGAYKPLLGYVKGEVFPLGSGGRGGESFRRVLLDIGKNITVTAQMG